MKEMKEIPLIAWVMLVGAGIPTMIVVTAAILDHHEDMGKRIFVGGVSTAWYLALVGVMIYARHQQKKGEEQLKQLGGK